MRKRIIGAAVVAGMGVTAVVAAVSAPAAHARGVEREISRACSAGAIVELNVEREHGFLDIDVEIEPVTPGERWTVAITSNGRAIGPGQVVADRDGEVDADRLVRAVRGVNRVEVRATSASGQTCGASIRI